MAFFLPQTCSAPLAKPGISSPVTSPPLSRCPPFPCFFPLFFFLCVWQFPSCPGVTVSHSQKRSLFFRRASSPLVKRIPQDEAKVPLQVRRRWWGHCVQLKSPFLVPFQPGVFSLSSSDLSCGKAGFPRNSWGRAHESCK